MPQLGARGPTTGDQFADEALKLRTAQSEEQDSDAPIKLAREKARPSRPRGDFREALDRPIQNVPEGPVPTRWNTPSLVIYLGGLAFSVFTIPVALLFSQGFVLPMTVAFGFVGWGMIWFWYVYGRTTTLPSELPWFILRAPLGQLLVGLGNPRQLGLPVLVEWTGFLLFGLGVLCAVIHKEYFENFWTTGSTHSQQVSQGSPNAPGTHNPDSPPNVNPGPTLPSKPAPADASGRLGYWKLDEGEGTTTADSSGQGHAATAVNAQWVAGFRGKALFFGGKESYLNYGDSSAFSFPAGAPFTLAFLVRTRAEGGTMLSQRNSKDGSPVIDIALSGGQVTATVRSDGNERAIPGTAKSRQKIDDGNWHHIALTRTGDTIELFIDSGSQARVSCPGADGAITTDLRALGAELYWLKHPSFGSPYFVGSVDEFAIYNRALKPEEIADLYKK